MKRAAIYTRISFDPTGTSFSPERQRVECERLAESRGWEVAVVYEDRDRSAFGKGRQQRPALLDLQAAVEAGGIDAVVAYSIARIARNTLDFHRLLEWLEDRGVTVVCVADPVDTTTAAGRLITTVISALAQMESELISERVTSAHRVRREQGRMPAGRNRHFGYTRQGEIIEEEAAFIREASARVIDGERTSAIAAWLNEEGSLTTAGNPWRYTPLQDMLSSARLVGQYDDGKPGSWDPIMSEADWSRLRTALASRVRRVERSASTLSGLVQCGLCGTRMHACTSGTGSKKVGLYACRKGSPGGCGGIAVTRKPLHAHVEGLVLENAHLFESPAEQKELEAALAEVEASLVELAHARFVDRAIGPAEFDSARAALQERSDRLADELEQAQALDVGLDLRVWWGGASEAEQVRWIRSAVRQVVVAPAAKRGGRFDPTRVSVKWSWPLLQRSAHGT